MKNVIYKCPVCNNPLETKDRSYCCCQNHTYDIAREGYVNLLLANQKTSKEPGDGKASVQARRSFLSHGYYDSLSSRLNTLVLKYLTKTTSEQKVVLDVGCGVGYYLSKLKKELLDKKMADPSLWGLDISRPAIQLAARNNEGVDFCVGSTFLLPFIDNSVDIALSVFAPLDADEVIRILKDDGKLIVVVPGRDHLSGLVKMVYQKSEPHRGDKDPIKGNVGLVLMDSLEVKEKIKITGQDNVMNLLSMTPYFWSIDLERKQALERTRELKTTIDFKILIYIKA